MMNAKLVSLFFNQSKNLYRLWFISAKYNDFAFDGILKRLSGWHFSASISPMITVLTKRRCFCNFTQLETNELAPFNFDGRILLIDKNEIDNCARDLLYENNDERLLGFDTESRPALIEQFIKNNKVENPFQKKKVSIVQICNRALCCIWILKKFESIPDSLEKILTDSKYSKICHGAENELKVLHDMFGVNSINFIDLYNISVHLKCNKKSLKFLVASFLKKNLNKSQQLSDWEKYPLSNQQIQYAATDAYATLQVYLSIKNSINLDKLLEKSHLYIKNFQNERSSSIKFDFPSMHFSPKNATLDNFIQKSHFDDEISVLSNICIEKGYGLHVDGIECCSNGFKSIFVLKMNGTKVVFKSSYPHISLRNAQNDAALNAIKFLKSNMSEEK